MASSKVVRYEGFGGVAVSLIGAALGALGIPRPVWIAILVLGICLLVFSVAQRLVSNRHAEGNGAGRDIVGERATIVNAPVGFLYGEGAHSDHSVFNVSFGGEPVPLVAPPQIPATREELDELRKEFLAVGARVQELIQIWYVNPHQALDRSGGSTQEEADEWRDQRQKLIVSLTGRKHTPESIEKQSQVRKDLWAAGVYENVEFFTSYSKPTRYRGIRMRSKFEAKIAKILDSNGIAWLYEPQRFVFSETSYRPDFYLPEFGIWIECKYRNDPEEFPDLYKVALLRQLGYHVSIVTFEDIRYLREKFVFVGEGENLMLLHDFEGEE